MNETTRTNALMKIAGKDDPARRAEDAMNLAAPFIEQHEGFRDKAYWDVDGWSIGHGHKMMRDAKTGKMRPVRKNDVMDLKTSSALVRQRLRDNASSMYRDLKWSRTLSPGALAALYDVAYNAGTGVLSSKKSPSLNKGMMAPGANRDAIVWRELPSYRTSAGKVLKGLENRRRDAIAAFRTANTVIPSNMVAKR